jgi:hypothetical protein
VQPLGRTRKARLLRDGDERGEVTELHEQKLPGHHDHR